MKLVYVHGINQQGKSAEMISTNWSNSIRKTLGDESSDWWGQVEVRTAFYGDVLFEETEKWKSTNDEVAPMGAPAAADNVESPELVSFYAEVQNQLGVSDEAVLQELQNTNDPVMNASPMAAGPHKGWLKAIAVAIEKAFPAAGPLLARLFLKQAGAYLHKPGLFEKINDMVFEQVFRGIEDFSDTVIVSHSLGTIVSYQLLREMDITGEIPLFLTLGSPLGIDTVQKRIGPPFIKPPEIKSWINGSDPEDFVALYKKLDKDTFGDAEVTNISDLENGHEDAHSIHEYLSHDRIVMPIRAALHQG